MFRYTYTFLVKTGSVLNIFTVFSLRELEAVSAYKVTSYNKWIIHYLYNTAQEYHYNTKWTSVLYTGF